MSRIEILDFDDLGELALHTPATPGPTPGPQECLSWRFAIRPTGTTMKRVAFAGPFSDGTVFIAFDEVPRPPQPPQ